MASEMMEILESNPDRLVVQKSHPLVGLWRSELTLSEFKILDSYLARINSRYPEKRLVTIEKGELEKLLGVTKINLPELKERLKHLMGNVVEVPDKTVKKGFKLVTLFEEATAEQDEYGVWQVRLECTTKAMQYFFNIENIGYIKYKLKCIVSLNSRYTYIMFCYIEKNKFMKSWVVDLNELKKILGCDKDEYAQEFKYFNRDVLKKIQKEIYEKTDCRYTYVPIKKGRSVVAIQFTVENLQESEDDFNPEEVPLEKYQEEPEDLWEEAIQDLRFTSEQVEELRQVLLVVPDHMLPQALACPDNLDIRRYHYMRIRVQELIRRNVERPIRNKFGYLLKMLKQDAKIPNP